MDIVEFRDGGYLQEANRLFFHPLGLAVEIMQETDDETGLKSPWIISGIWDVRDDPEGVQFNEEYMASDEAARKAQNVEREMRKRSEVRAKGLGFVIQPLGDEPHKGKKKGK